MFFVLADCSSEQDCSVHKYFTKCPLRRRIVALAAAYAIALSGIIANFGASGAAAAESSTPGTVTCHTEIAGDPSPTDDQDNGKACADSCCIGCLMLTAALPPPSATPMGALRSPGQILPPPVVSGFASSPQSKSNQSRAPPFDV
jgi:hypothetical protein